MKLDFYHWAYQCPLNHEMTELLKRYSDRLDISLYDVGETPALAVKMKMYYPTLTVVADRFRFYSPLTPGFLDALCRGEVPSETPYRPRLGTKEAVGELTPITEKNYFAASGCTGKSCAENSARKREFLRGQGLTVYGYMNVRGGELLGGAEYLPSLLVPYDIPKHPRTAFLTCVYRSDEEFDYKTAPLRALEAYLAKEYDKLLAISDEDGVFPNGDRSFFIRNGYKDQGVLAHDPYCTLHLMGKNLR